MTEHSINPETDQFLRSYYNFIKVTKEDINKREYEAKKWCDWKLHAELCVQSKVCYGELIHIQLNLKDKRNLSPSKMVMQLTTEQALTLHTLKTKNLVNHLEREEYFFAAEDMAKIVLHEKILGWIISSGIIIPQELNVPEESEANCRDLEGES